MTVDELGRIFGVVNSSQVDEYEVIYIRRHRVSAPTRPFPNGDNRNTKRSSPQDSHAHYSFSANGKYGIFAEKFNTNCSHQFQPYNF